MKLDKLWRKLLFPHVAVMLSLIPVAAVFLVYSMLSLEETSWIRIASYVTAFYVLAVWCIRIPQIVCHVRRIKKENKYISTWLGDPRLRVNVTLVVSMLWNGAYAALQLGMGIVNRSVWFYATGAYYASLAIMRLFLARHTLRHRPRERMYRELIGYRLCGWIFLIMNLFLSGMMLYMIRDGEAIRHNEITVIALATYTFTSLTTAIVNTVRYRKYDSPAFSASKAVSLAAACVSVLTLENTMLATFGDEKMTPWVRGSLLGFSGGAVSVFIIVMAICMIVKANKKMKYPEG